MKTRFVELGLGLASLVLALGVGCMPVVGEGQPEAAPAPTRSGGEPDAPAPADGPFEVVVDGRPAQPPGQALTPGPGRHAEHVGWRSGQRFTHCHARAGDCYECRTVARDGTTESVESGPGCASGIPRARLDAELRADPPGSGATRWGPGARVVLVVETREQEQTNAGQPRPLLKVGARRKEDPLPAFVLHVDPCEGCGTDQICAGQAHLDALTLSPDGHEVVALVHSVGNDGVEQLRVERMPADSLVAAAQAPASRAP